LLEKQRNPGVGYWASRETNGSNSRTSISSESDRPTGAASPTNESKAEEDVNLEYLRNVILQFLEHKEMRVRVPCNRDEVIHADVWYYLCLAESCEDPHYHLEIYSTGDQEAQSQLVNWPHSLYSLLTYSFLLVPANCINLYLIAL
jgi:hypothetical protein